MYSQQSHPSPDQIGTLNHAHYVGDQPLTEAIFRTRTARQQARDLGAKIDRWHKRKGTWNALQFRGKSKTAAMLLFKSMCYDYGTIEGDDRAALIVRLSIKDIADDLGFNPVSFYRTIRTLEEVGAVNRLRGNGNRAHHYEVRIEPPKPGEPLDEEETEAGADDSVAAGARASSDALLLSSARPDRNSLTERESALLPARALLLSSARQSASDSFSTGESALFANAPDAAQGARASSESDAPGMYVHDDELTYMPEDAAERKAVLAVILSCGVHEPEAGKHVETTNLIEATAIKIAQARMTNLRRPGGWARNRLVDKVIPDWAMQEAERRLSVKQTPATVPAPPAPPVPVVDMNAFRANVQARLQAMKGVGNA